MATGDTAKYLDEWTIQNQKVAFNKRLKPALAGHTAIISVGGHFYLGSDFSNRPNYIERMDGKKFFFPEQAYKMYVLKFKKYQDRYIISLSKELPCFGARYSISVFDTQKEEFVYCDYQDRTSAQMFNLADSQIEIQLRSMSAGELAYDMVQV